MQPREASSSNPPQDRRRPEDERTNSTLHPGERVPKKLPLSTVFAYSCKSRAPTAMPTTGMLVDRCERAPRSFPSENDADGPCIGAAYSGAVTPVMRASRARAPSSPSGDLPTLDALLRTALGLAGANTTGGRWA